MLILFRYPHLHRCVAFVVAFAFLVLAVVGEAFHYEWHKGASGTDAKVRSVAIIPGGAGAPAPPGMMAVGGREAADSCPICDWEKTPAITAVACAPFLIARSFLPRFIVFTEELPFVIRQITVLRESRGPPSLA